MLPPVQQTFNFLWIKTKLLHEWCNGRVSLSQFPLMTKDINLRGLGWWIPQVVKWCFFAECKCCNQESLLWWISYSSDFIHSAMDGAVLGLYIPKLAVVSLYGCRRIHCRMQIFLLYHSCDTFVSLKWYDIITVVKRLYHFSDTL